MLGTRLAFLGLGSLGSLSLAPLWSGRDRRHASRDTCPDGIHVSYFRFGYDKGCTS